VFELPGLRGLNPHNFWLYSPNSCSRITLRVNSNPLEGTRPIYCVHAVEGSNDKERGQCSKNDQ